jgi:competence protein ComEA
VVFRECSWLPTVLAMLSRRPSPEHQEAVARRLALLSAELAGVREDSVVPEAPPPDEPAYALPMTHTRVPQPRASPPDDTAPDHVSDEPPPVPQPGRHASRRPARRTGLVPATLRGRTALGPAQLALVAVMVVIGLAVTGWWVVRGQARTVVAAEAPAPVAGLATPVESETDPVSVTSPSASDTGATVTVDVTGKVRRPGIVVLDSGSRVVDALKAAGGVRPGVDTGSLNLARVLVDGEQIVVGVPVATGVNGMPMPSASPGGALVNLNTATQTELESLPEVGPVTAQSILAWRSEHGAFSSVDELLEVDGIGDATLATIAPHVTV